MHQAALHRCDEVVLTGEVISHLAGNFDAARIPSHVELTARLHAESSNALDRGDPLLDFAE